jgi:hypothetical protein
MICVFPERAKPALFPEPAEPALPIAHTFSASATVFYLGVSAPGNALHGPLRNGPSSLGSRRCWGAVCWGL